MTDGFKFNPYDQCLDNNILEGEPLTRVFHEDDVKSSHKETNVVDNFENELNLCMETQRLVILNH